MFLLRVALPDRPGSLGAVATAMGSVGADILAVEIVEKDDRCAVDDFMVELPAGALPDALVSACSDIDGVRVLWFSHHPIDWGLQGDAAVLDEMTQSPEQARTILTHAAPKVFRVTWAAEIDKGGAIVTRTELAPEEPLPLVALGNLREAHPVELNSGWLTGWPDMLAAVVPLRRGAMVVARAGGPEFTRSELARLRHLAALAH